MISGSASIVKKEHAGYLYTQNYIKLKLTDKIDPHFLIYLLNEDQFIKKQFQMGLQGSVVMKYTLKQLKDLKSRVASLETTVLLHRLKEEAKNV